MRGIGLWFGSHRRNDPVKLSDPHPLTDYGDDLHSGDAGRDGFSVLARANPDAQGSMPPVSGAIGPAYQSPDGSFEQ